jgi:hypothetical protein
VQRDVGLAQRFGVGPSGSARPDTGEPYLGLYQTAFFPFVDGLFSVLVSRPSSM